MNDHPPSTPVNSYTIIKKNTLAQETWRYQGRLLNRTMHSITIEAFFDREDIEFYGMTLARGDRFVETFYTDRWYNIFEIHASPDDRLRGWYCNIARPADISAGTISYIDLALDLLAFPDGCQIVLDEDEFTALEISAEWRQQALQALTELQTVFQPGKRSP